jgi:uncharacterized phage-associated protein
MVSVFDVAAFILSKQGGMTVMKLHKLVYYCQAWSLVWEDEPLLTESIEAWANGPVIRELYNAHQGQFKIERADIPGNPNALDENQKETVKTVLRYYGDKSSQWLSNLIHAERPWRDARQGLADKERGSREISLAALAEYYEGVYHEGTEIEAAA